MWTAPNFALPLSKKNMYGTVREKIVDQVDGAMVWWRSSQRIFFLHTIKKWHSFRWYCDSPPKKVITCYFFLCLVLAGQQLQQTDLQKLCWKTGTNNVTIFTIFRYMYHSQVTKCIVINILQHRRKTFEARERLTATTQLTWVSSSENKQNYFQLVTHPAKPRSTGNAIRHPPKVGRVGNHLQKTTYW